MGAVIASIGTATPSLALEQRELAEVAVRTVRASGGDATAIRSLYRGTRIRSRGAMAYENGTANKEPEAFYPISSSVHDRGPTTGARMAAYLHHASAMGTEASADALERACVDPGAVTHLVSVSCTGFCAPGLDIAIVDALELDRCVERTHVGFMGCHGALNGLGVARSIAASEPDAVVLMCAAEVCSLHFSYAERVDQRVANALFADGAAACVVRGEGTAAGEWEILSRGSCVLPETEELMGWRIGDHGFEMSLGEGVPRVIEASLLEWMDRWLAREGVRVEDVRGWAVHPGGPRVLDAVGRALRLSSEALLASRGVLRDHGNMSSPTCLFILDRVGQGLSIGDLSACLAFGPGLSFEGILLRRL